MLINGDSHDEARGRGWGSSHGHVRPVRSPILGPSCCKRFMMASKTDIGALFVSIWVKVQYGLGAVAAEACSSYCLHTIINTGSNSVSNKHHWFMPFAYRWGDEKCGSFPKVDKFRGLTSSPEADVQMPRPQYDNGASRDGQQMQVHVQIRDGQSPRALTLPGGGGVHYSA